MKINYKDFGVSVDWEFVGTIVVALGISKGIEILCKGVKDPQGFLGDVLASVAKTRANRECEEDSPRD